MKTSSILKLSTGIAFALAALPTVATAQTEAAPAVAEEAAANEGLGEIVVTAQRRAESSQKAAIAITAVGADTLARAGVTDTTALTKVAPALQIGTLAGPMTQFYVRGVGKFTANSLSDGAISVNIDGVPLARDGAIQGLFYDLERVEVLKGPQGTLYGRNATGGAINLISAKPKAGEFGGYFNAEYGNFDSLKLNAAINLPAGEDGAFRIAATSSDHDGYYSDGTGDEKLRAVRVQAMSKLTDTFKLTVGGDFAYAGGIGSGSTVKGLNRSDRIGLSDPRAVAVYTQVLAVPGGSLLQPLVQNQFQSNRYWGMYAQADVDTSIGTVTLIPSHRNADVEYRINSGTFPVNDRMKQDQTTVEARLTSDNSSRLSYILGGFFLKENILQRPGYAEQYFNAHGTFDTETTSYAAFARLTYKLTDELRLSGGIRYTIDKKQGDLSAYNILVTCPSLFSSGTPCIGTPALPNQVDMPTQFIGANNTPYGPSGAVVTTTFASNSVRKTFKKATYRAGIEYDVAPQSLLYATFETGFKSGGFFNSIDDPTYRPETITAYTLGSKNRFMGNRLQLNLEAFWWEYKDQQVSHFRTSSAGSSEFVTENIGKSRIRGFEIEGRARVLDGTTLNATVQYLDAETTDFVYTNPAVNGPPTTGCPVRSLGAVNEINCSGRRVVNAPEWAINAGIEQVFEIGEGRLTLNADGRYQTKIYTGFEQLPTMLQTAYFTLDLSAQYEFPGSHLTIGAFANNVTDKNVVGFSTPHPFAKDFVAESLRPPRTYGVRVGYKF